LRISESLRETALLCERYRVAGLSVGLVPTMGALHAGHLALLEEAREECERVVVSHFVNPTQFGRGEDLDAYPRSRAADIEACRRAGADLAYFAADDEIYPRGFQTWVTVESLTRPLCGATRPTHFRGVATVVTQLLHIVRPHKAYFGQKDYQQFRVIERLATDLHLGVDIRVVETVREPDGLAMSSRNAYLTKAERDVAPRIRRALLASRETILAGERRVDKILAVLNNTLRPGTELKIDYAEVRNAVTLEEFPGAKVVRDEGVLIAVAVNVGKARLIDNVVIGK